MARRASKIDVWREKKETWESITDFIVTDTHRSAIRSALFNNKNNFPWWTDDVTRAIATVAAEELEGIIDIAVSKLAIEAAIARTSARDEAESVLSDT